MQQGCQQRRTEQHGEEGRGPQGSLQLASHAMNGMENWVPRWRNLRALPARGRPPGSVARRTTTDYVKRRDPLGHLPDKALNENR